MNEVEYLLRIVLKARDELAGTFAGATAKVKAFESSIEGADKKLNSLNTTVTSFSRRLNNLNKNIQDSDKAFNELGSGAAQKLEVLDKKIKSTTDELVKNSKAARAAADEHKNIEAAFDRLAGAQDKLTERYKKGQLSTRDFGAELRKLQNEADRVAKKLDIGDERADVFRDISRNAKIAGDDIAQTIKDIGDARKKASADQLRAAQDDIQQQRAVRKSLEDQQESAVKLNDEYDRLSQRMKKLDQDYRSGKRDRDEFVQGMRDLSSEANKLGNTFEAADSGRFFFQRLANDAKVAGNEVKKQIDAEIADRARQNAEREKSLDASRKEAAAQRDLERSIATTLDKAEELNVKRARHTAISAEDTARMKENIQQMDRLRRQVDQNSTEFQRLTAAAATSERILSRAGVTVKRVSNNGDDANRAYSRLNSTMRNTQRQGGGLIQTFNRLAEELSGNGERVAQLDNNLRGMLVLAVLVFAQQLTTILTGLGGELIALAGSAAMAGGALGGAFAAGLAQALPAVGVLAAAIHRLSIINKALTESDLVRQQTAQRADKQAAQESVTTDALANAQDSLASAHERVADAQKNLTQARSDARRQLTDLVLAEKDAELAAKGAVLSQKEAQQQLQAAVASGDTLGIQQAQLGVQEAAQNVRRTRVASTRATADRQRVGGDIENTEGVQAAEKQMRDAEVAATKASRAMDKARINTTKATEGYFAAQSALDYMISQLTPAEKKLYDAVQRIQATYRKQFRGVTDIIVSAFARGVDAGDKMLRNPRIIQAATQMAEGISNSIDNALAFFQRPDILNQVLRIVAQFRPNLAIVDEIVTRLAKAFLNIAEAGGPALRNILKYISDLAGRFLGLTTDSGKLTKFFLDGEKHLEAWVELGISVIRLFAALTGAGGADSGLKSVNDATKAIDGLTEKVNDNQGKVRKFFDDARRVTGEVLKVVGSLGIEMLKSFNPENVASMGRAIRDVIIPALGQAVRAVGRLTRSFTDFVSAHPEITKFVVVALLMTKVFNGVNGVIAQTIKQFTQFANVFSKSIGSIAAAPGKISRLGSQFAILRQQLQGNVLMTSNLSRGMQVINQRAPIVGRALALMMGPWGLLLVAIVAGVVLLLTKFHEWGKIVDGLKDAFSGFLRAIQPAIDAFKKSLQDLGISFHTTGGFAKTMHGVLKTLADIITGVIIVGFKIFAGLLAGFVTYVLTRVTGVIKVIKGVFDIFKGLITLNPRLFLQGIKELVGGILDQFTALPKAIIAGIKAAFGDDLIDTLLSPFKAAWNAVKRFFGFASPARVATDLGDGIKDGLVRGLRGLASAITAPFRAGWRAIKSVFNGARDFAEDVVTRILRGWANIGSRLLRVGRSAWQSFKDGFRGALNFGKNIVDGIVDAIKGLPDKFKSIGQVIVDAGKEFATQLRKGIEKIPGGKILLKGGELVNKALDAVNPFAKGGPVPGSGSGDTVRALLTPGEHVWTKSEVSNAGGHGVLFALRSLFGGGGQGGGGRFADGGAVGSAASLTVDFNSGSMDDFTGAWRAFWSDITATARRGTNTVEAQFRDMRVNTTRSVDRMYRDIRSSLADIEQSFEVRMGRAADGLSDTVGSMQNVVYRGFDYIQRTAKTIIRAFDGKVPDISLVTPRQFAHRAATGGVIGQWGERGRDSVHTLLGRGEVVLNAGHQLAINAALAGQNTLQSLLSGVRGYHAGGPEQPGFAAGKINWGSSPHNINSNLVSALRKIFARFPDAVLTSTTNHSYRTTSGNVSDHVGGNAADVSFPGNSKERLNALARFVLGNGMARQAKQAIYQGDPSVTWSGGKNVGAGFFGPAVMAQHANHLHYALIGALRGIAAGSTDTQVPSVRAKVVGGGPITNLTDTILRYGRRVANRMLLGVTQAVDAESDAGAASGGGVAAPPGQHRSWIRQALKLAGIPVTDANVNAQYRLDMGESSGNPKIIQQISDINSARGQRARGIAQVIPPTFAQYKLPGHDDIFNPVDNIIASVRYQMARYGRLVGHAGYAAGGPIPGSDGAPVNILAHAGEWVLNKAQQARAAALAGLSPAGLRSFLGFGGSNERGFLSGGEVGYFGDSLGVGTLGELRDLLRGIKASYTKVGASSSAVYQQMARILKTEVGQAVKKVVFDVGTNDSTAKQLAASVKQALRAVGSDRELLVPTLHGPGSAAKNRVLRQLAGQNDNLRLINERGIGGIAGDQIHYSPQGYETRARRVMAALRQAVDAATKGVEVMANALKPLGKSLNETQKFAPDISLLSENLRKTLDVIRRAKPGKAVDDALTALTSDSDPRGISYLNSQVERDVAVRNRRTAGGRFSLTRLASGQYTANALTTAAQDNINAISDAQYELTLRRMQQRELQRALAALNARMKREKDPKQQQKIQGAINAVTEGLDQVSDAVISAQENVVNARLQEFQARIDAVNNTASDALAGQDRQGRIADVIARFGGQGPQDAVNAAQLREIQQAGRTGILQQQRQGIAALLGQATTPDQIRDLTQQLQELDTSIIESTATQRELAAATRAAMIEQITNRQQFRGGIASGLGSIIEGIGQLTGIPDLGRQTANLQYAGRDLAYTGAGLRNQLLSQFGVDLRAFTGLGLVDAIQSLPTDAIESSLSEPDRQNFETLINAIIDNENAVIQNTTSIKQLTAATTQTFTSSAWRLFRNAIFTGMGGLLPQYGQPGMLDHYQIPSAASGGWISRTGLINVHAGEVVGDAETIMQGSGDTNVYFTQPVEDADPLAIASAIAWQRRSRPRR